MGLEPGEKCTAGNIADASTANRGNLAAADQVVQSLLRNAEVKLNLSDSQIVFHLVVFFI